VDEIAIACYRPIYESRVRMLGEECYRAVRPDPQLTWEQRKIGQIHRLYQEQADWLWVLEEDGQVFGFITFRLHPQRNYGQIENNGILPERAGRGWGKFMYRHVLNYFREQGLRFAYVDTGLDAAHEPARRAYEGVGFDRQVPTVEYWQDLSQKNAGSIPE
jgi:ribosomal protein S18 acetylase RimI-like enzyme